MEQQIKALLDSIANGLQLEIIEVRLEQAGSRQLLRVIADKSGGVSSDDLEHISRALSLQLDAADLIRGNYMMEVSSPGLNWPLTRESDLQRHLGEWLKVTFPDGRVEIGENLGPVANGFRLRNEAGEEHEFKFSAVSKVIRTINWKESGGGKAPGKKKQVKDNAR